MTELTAVDGDVTGRTGLDVSDLHVTYPSAGGPLKAVRGVDLSVAAGERVGLIGESGSGKTTLVAALMGLLPRGATMSGELSIGDDSVDVGAVPEQLWRDLRGRRIAAVPQGAMSGLHPTHRVDAAVAEVMMVHHVAPTGANQNGNRSKLDKNDALELARDLLADVGLDERARRAFPHELSGGMRQRVALAAALASRPDILIADEPTVGLDVVVAARFIDLLLERQRTDGFGLLIVSHDLTTVRRSTDRLLVMYAGRIVEATPTERAADIALHPYAQGLFAAAPSLHERGWSAIPGTAPALDDVGAGCAFSDRCPHTHDACTTTMPTTQRWQQRSVECHLYADVGVGVEPVRTSFPTVRERPSAGEETEAAPVVQVRSATKTFRSRRWFTTTETRALVDVDLDVGPGEIVGLVGVSGSGKSTLARSLFGLVLPDSGEISVAGEDMVAASRSELRRLRRRIAFVHQDPYASLHPAMSIVDLVAEPLAIGNIEARERRRRAAAALVVVGLSGEDDFLQRRAGQLSGGQRQRVAIARAFVAEPVLMVLDEPMSMLDASVRAGIANALLDVRDLGGMAAVVITHDLAEAAAICDRIVVLDAGRVVEDRPTPDLIADPNHEATRRLLQLAAPDVPATTHGTTMHSATTHSASTYSASTDESEHV